ncbi:MAG: phage tail protein [Anaerolineales bacterium]|nr:phage tail protein [Anaerolineales bacterium]
MPTGSRTDPLVGYHFHVEIDGISQAQFRECTGLDSENEIIEYKEAGTGGQTIIRKQPGALKWSNLELKRGITDIMELWEWRKLVEQGKVNDARKNGSVVLYNQANEEIARWNFVDGWPSKISGPQAKADGNEVAIEALTIAHEGLERVK